MIAFERVSRSYDGGASFAVRTVDLGVPAQGFTALIGGSGSGKTTLLKLVNRLIEPDEGRILVDGVDIRDGPAHALRRRVGYVFQDVGLFPHMTAAENIGVTPRLLGRPATEIAARVEELLDLVRLPAEFAGRYPSALSGGQRQRVGLARALAARPRIMLMDEPFGALDPLTREDIGADYLRLHQTLGLTTLMVTHDVQEAVILADRIAVMRQGRLLAEGAPGELAAHPDDYVRSLLDAPRRQAARITERLGAARR